MMDDIKLEQIQQKKVRKYVEDQIEEGKHKFSEIRPSWEQGNDLSPYRKNEMTFFLKGNLKEIWKEYISSDFSKSWNGRKISLGLLLQIFPANIFYNHDPVSGVNIGQVFFLNLKILLGFFNLPVAFEIITLDDESKTIEFSYIEGNKSLGVQQVRFLDIGGGRTEIMHTSYYKSDSHFRDKWIYPYFHRRIVNDFHRNMRRLLKLKRQNEDEIVVPAVLSSCRESY
jgi:hypothetical protein